MITLRQAAQQALEALENSRSLEQAYRHVWSNLPDGSYRTTYYWIEQGFRYAEQAHGIKGDA